jgi:hypothetical protein
MDLPYRAPNSGIFRERSGRPKRCGDYGLLPVFALFWALSLVRVIGGVLGSEVFGAEGTLALMAVAGIPWLVLGRPARS